MRTHRQRPTLTDRLVAAAKPPQPTPEGRAVRYLRDGVTPGFGLRVTEAGNKAFYFEAKFKGRTKRIILGAYPGTKVQAARNEAHARRGDLAKGIDPTADRRGQRGEQTLAALIEGWRTGDLFDGDKHGVRLEDRKRSWKDDEQRLRDFIEPWAKRRLSDISRDEASELHTRIARDNGPYVANRTLALLRAMLRVGQRKKLVAPGPLPTDGIQPCEERPRERALNRKEARAILQSIAAEPNPHWRAYFVLLLMLGRRRGELLSAEWKEIDLESDEPSWRLPRTKAGRVELVELPPQAVAILKGLSSEDHSPFVFPGTGERGHLREPKRAWARILERAKVNDVRLHDLRRTVGKWLRRSGASLQAVSLVLGHSQISTTSKHYTSLDREDRRETLERMATMLLEALPDEPTPDARE